MGAAAQIAAWLGLWAVELVFTRQFHPTLPIAVLATGVLVGTSAIAAYTHLLVLRPRWKGVRWFGSLATLIAVLTCVAVASIQGIYGILWHPDPLRFGLPFNLTSDCFILSVHVAGAALIAWVRSRRSVSQPVAGMNQR